MKASSKAFEPLTDQEKKVKKQPTNQEEWKPFDVVPDNAPEPQIQHPKHGRPAKIYPWLNQVGRLMFNTCRFEFKNGDKQVLPFTYCKTRDGSKTAWRWRAPRESRPLFGLELLAKESRATVVIVEGEKTCLAARELLPDCVVMTSLGGSNAALKTDWRPLQNRKVIIWPDNDDAGLKYADQVKELLLKNGVSCVGITKPPKDKEKGWDAADAYSDGWQPEDAKALIDKADLVRPEPFIPKCFIINPDGIYYRSGVDDNKDDVFVCSPLEIVARTRDHSGENWGHLLQWRDEDGRQHRLAMPDHWLSGDGKEIRAYLLDRGLNISNRYRSKLIQYIETVKPPFKATSISKIGWNEGRFALPDAIIPETNEMFLQSELDYNCFNVSGTLDDWKENVGKYTAGNSRLTLAACTAFAAPLLRFVGGESGGFHFRGKSSQGKSTALWFAGSIWGGDDNTGYIKQWRATANGIEGMAQAHNDCLLCLDEMGQIDGREVGETAYMLANGDGKVRMNKSVSLRKSLKWRLLFLSTGEVSLADKMLEAGKQSYAGMETRLVDLPSDSGSGLGLFDYLHGFESGEVFSRHLKDMSRKYYGSPIRAYIKSLIDLGDDEIKRITDKQINDFIADQLPKEADGQVKRVAGRFGILQAAGLLAIEAGVLPIDSNDMIHGLNKCFRAWLDNRGTIGDLEVLKGIEQIKAFFEMHGASRFGYLQPILGTVDKEDSELQASRINEVEKVVNRAGFKRKDADGYWEYFVYPSVFNKEMCKGLNHVDLNPYLINQGYLIPDKKTGAACKNQRLPRPEGVKRMYHFSGKIGNET